MYCSIRYIKDILNRQTDLSQSAGRLEVLKQCVGFIFSDKIAEAKKVYFVFVLINEEKYSNIDK